MRVCVWGGDVIEITHSCQHYLDKVYCDRGRAREGEGGRGGGRDPPNSVLAFQNTLCPYQS